MALYRPGTFNLWTVLCVFLSLALLEADSE
jgi:hypothetical protein